MLISDIRGDCAVHRDVTVTRPFVVESYRQFVAAAVKRFAGSVLEARSGEIVAVFSDDVAPGSSNELAVLCAMSLQRERSTIDAHIGDRTVRPIEFGIALHCGVEQESVDSLMRAGREMCRLASSGEIVASRPVWTTIPPALATHFGPSTDVSLRGHGGDVAIRWTRPRDRDRRSARSVASPR